MRLTRAAQRAQQDGETLPAALAEEPMPVKTPAQTPAKKGKGRTGKKGTKAEEKPATDDGEVELQAIVDTATETVVHELPQVRSNGGAEVVSNDEHTKVPQTPSIRLTRRQLAKLEQEGVLDQPQADLLARDEATSEVVAEQDTEQAETGAEECSDIVPEAEPQAEQGEHAAVATKSASKPARRTRRQRTKLEEQSADAAIDTAAARATADTATVATGEVYAPNEIEHASEQNGTASTNEASLYPEPDQASKLRLTRRQQANLGAKHEQQTPRHNPGREIAAEIATEAGTQAGDVQEEASDNQARTEAIGFEEPTSSAYRTLDKHPSTKDKLDAKLLEPVKTAAAPGGYSKTQIDVYQGTGAATVDEESAECVDARPATPTDAEFENDHEAQADCHAVNSNPTYTELVSEAEPKMLCEKLSEISLSTPIENQASIQHSSQSPSKSLMYVETSSPANDKLEADSEPTETTISNPRHSDENPSQDSTTAPVSTATRGETHSGTHAKYSAHVSGRTPAMSTSKATRKPSDIAPVASKLLAAKESIAMKASRVSNTSKAPSTSSKSVKPMTTSLARASSVRTVSNKNIRKTSTEAADYLSSKRRPISLSFPAPPPPPKGKAPTKPTFHLSSDSVAAKLRAQKEERMKRETESTAASRQRPISMPPPAKSTKPPTVPSFQLPGEATAARLKAQKEERLKRMEVAGGTEKPTTQPLNIPAISRSTKPSTKPNFRLPGEATAARLKAQKEERLKRIEEAENARKATPAAPARKSIAHRPRESLLVRKVPGPSIPPPSQSAPQPPNSLADVRISNSGPTTSCSTSTSSSNRDSTLLAEHGKSTFNPVAAVAPKYKGKQVFNRDQTDKETMERERKEKEEAAKKARAEAAERGRIASREWAERQRKKLKGA